MRVLVTRPEDDAQETAARLRALGHEPLIAPLLTVRFLNGPEPSLNDVQAVLITSANGVRALAERTGKRNIPIFAVGRQSAEAARLAGFSQVHNADGDADRLAERVTEWSTPSGGVLLHAAGRETEGRLAAMLVAKGYSVRTLNLYDVDAASRLPPNAETALESGALDVAMHFSPRSARVFRACVERAGLVDSCAKLIAICISAAAADALTPAKFRETRVAGAPNQDAMLACLG